jgi:adenylate cyclase class 2
MKTEFEITFLKINKDQIREKIRSIWWICKKENSLMRRVVFESPENKKWSYVRVRDEWDKITTTYKEEKQWDLDITSVAELETTVGNFEEMVAIYKKLGLKAKSYQETYRETWEINWEIEFMIDEWPWLSPYIEIEWEDEEMVRKYTKLLWFDYNDGVFGSVFEIYEKELWLDYDYINWLERITFDEPPVK